MRGKVQFFKNNNADLKKFSSMSIVMTLFYLYLFKKYKSNCTLVFPQDFHYRFGLVLSMKMPSNMMAIEEIAGQLLNCIQRGVQTIIIPVVLIFDTVAHANVLIYRSAGHLIEHFEPHGDFYDGEDNELAFIQYELGNFIRTLNGLLRANQMREVTVYESEKVCPQRYGFQIIEELVPNKNETIGGYCAAWSMFFTELALANPSLSSREIVDIVYAKVGGLNGGKYLKAVIEGYSNHVSDKLEKYYSMVFGEKMTTVEIQRRHDAATNEEKQAIYAEFRTIVQIEMKLMFEGKTSAEQISSLWVNGQGRDTETSKILRNLQIMDSPTLSDTYSESLSSLSSEIKTCPPGMIYNPLTRRFNKIKPAKQIKTKKIKPKKICPPGSFLNERTNRCNKIKKT